MKNAYFTPPAAASVLIAVLCCCTWACTGELTQPPTPAPPPLAANTPQGNPEDVQDECTCKLSVQSVSGSNTGIWELNDWPHNWSIRILGNTGNWTFWLNNAPVASGNSLPTGFFELLPLSEGEVYCNEFRIENLSGENIILHVKVRCYLDGVLASEVNDTFDFSQGHPVPGEDPLHIRRFYRQYICQVRTAGNPDPCKEGTEPGGGSGSI